MEIAGNVQCFPPTEVGIVRAPMIQDDVCRRCGRVHEGGPQNTVYVKFNGPRQPKILVCMKRRTCTLHSRSICSNTIEILPCSHLNPIVVLSLRFKINLRLGVIGVAKQSRNAPGHRHTMHVVILRGRPHTGNELIQPISELLRGYNLGTQIRIDRLMQLQRETTTIQGHVVRIKQTSTGCAIGTRCPLVSVEIPAVERINERRGRM